MTLIILHFPLIPTLLPLLCCRQAAESARKEGVALGGQVVLSVSASSDLPLWKIVNKVSEPLIMLQGSIFNLVMAWKLIKI